MALRVRQDIFKKDATKTQEQNNIQEDVTIYVCHPLNQEAIAPKEKKKMTTKVEESQVNIDIKNDKIKCEVCEKKIKLRSMSKHTWSVHCLLLSEYKKLYGDYNKQVTFNSTKRPKTPENIQSDATKKRKCLQDLSQDINIPTKFLKRSNNSQAVQIISSSMDDRKNNVDVRFSNDMKDACKTVCRVCKKPNSISKLRYHVRQMHNIPIDEYRKTHGNPRDAIIEKVYHKCGLCIKSILLDSDEISSHLRSNHSISHKNYNAQYMKTKDNALIHLNEEKIQMKQENSKGVEADDVSLKVNNEKKSNSIIHNEDLQPQHELNITIGENVYTTRKNDDMNSTSSSLDAWREKDLKSMSTAELLKAIDFILS